MFKKLFKISMGALAVLSIVASSAMAGSIPSSKSGAAMSNGIMMEASSASVNQATAESWKPVLTTYIKVAGGKELIMNLAVQCGLYTRTLAKSKGGKTSTSVAEGSVKMRVKIQKMDNDGITPIGDPKFASPSGDSGVTYCSRAQTLSAKFQGIFQTDEDATLIAKLTVDGGSNTDEGIVGSFYATMDECLNAGDANETDGLNTCVTVSMVGTCLEQDPVTGAILLDLECLEPEEVELILDTVNANAFNYVSPNLTAGVYKVTAESIIHITGSATSEDSNATDIGDWEAKAVVGMGSMMVDEVRFITNATGETMP